MVCLADRTIRGPSTLGEAGDHGRRSENNAWIGGAVRLSRLEQAGNRVEAERTDLLERSIATTARLLADVNEDRWSSPSPCPDMTALGVVQHLVGGLTQFAATGAQEPFDERSLERSFSGEDAREEYQAAGDRMMAVWSQPGVAERDYPMPWGDSAGSDLIGFMLIEQVTHGWDIAKATGQEPGYDSELVEATLDLARGYDDESIRVPGMFGPIVPAPDGGPAIDRLAAFLGRHPDEW